MNGLLQVGWTWHPTVVIGVSLWTLLYVFAIWQGPPTQRVQQIGFHVGSGVLFLALVSPLDQLGDEYLFSAHMVQHLLLMFVIAPLWLIGIPGWLVDKIIPKRLIRLVNWLVGPTFGFVAFVGVMWFWHIPSIYGVAQASEATHILEHLTMIGAALIGWWPVAGADQTRISKPEPPLRMVYLFLLAIPCTSLAAVFTFAHKPLYPFYVAVQHPFGLDVLQDQRLGGLLMWLPTHMFLLVALGITFLNWFTNSTRLADQELAKSSM